MPETLKTPGLCLAAVQNDGEVLQFVPKALKTPGLCLAAVQNHGYALQDVPKALKTPELCLAAVQNKGWALQYVPEDLKTPELCLAAVQKNGRAIRFVPGAQLRKKRFPRRLASGDIGLVRLSLRNDPARLEEFFALYNKNQRHLRPWHNEREALLFKNIAAMKAHIRKQKVSWHAVYYTGAMVGLVELRDCVDYIGLSYWTDEASTRKGIAYAAIAMMEQALSAMQCGCLQVEISPDNEPSINLMKKLNYEEDGVRFSLSGHEDDCKVMFRKML